MHGVSWDSVLSWDESRDLSLDLRLSLDLSCPPLAPWRLIFVQSIPLATRDEVLKTEEKCSAFQSFRNTLHLNFKGIQNMYIECKLWRLILFTSIFFLCCTHVDICKQTMVWDITTTARISWLLLHDLQRDAAWSDETTCKPAITKIPSRTGYSNTTEYFI